MNTDSEFNDIIPYRTESGLQIGKRYKPPKIYGSGDDILDLSDSYMIQSALIADSEQLRKDKLIDIAFVSAMVFLIVAVVIFL
jgi:hypothetical protein